MASDVLGKAFRKATAEASKQYDSANIPSAPVKDADQIMREDAKPMTATDGIQRILLAWKDRDYFR